MPVLRVGVDTILGAAMTNPDEQLASLNEHAARHDLEALKVCELAGRYALMLAYRPNPTYEKYFTTAYYDSLSELFALVGETLEDDNVNIFSSNLFEYLSGEMIGDKSITLTIKDVVEETLTNNRGKEDKPVMSFVERKKKWVLNKTSARHLAEKLGPETSEWAGHRVTLHTETVPAFGRSVKAIRIKNILPPVEAAPVAKVAKPVKAANGNGNANPFDGMGGLNGRAGVETVKELLKWGPEAYGPDWDDELHGILDAHNIQALDGLTEAQAQALLAEMVAKVG
jgi:hypothetical protein